MVKLKTICRSEKEFVRETKQEINKVHRNQNPNLHPFQKAREYQRALQATKLEKIFAKPFLGALEGHSDFISVFAKSPNSMVNFLSGSYDGEIRFWDISQRKTIFQINAHESMIKGMVFSKTGGMFLSTGGDNIVNLYELEKCLDSQVQNGIAVVQEASNKFVSKVPLNNIDIGVQQDIFATSGQIVQIWNYDRSMPIQTFEWGCDSVLKIQFNKSESHILASTGIDRSVILYDIKGGLPIHKIFLANKCQALQWNPQEPINFTVGSDDANCYTFDMRKMDVIKNIHKDHIKSVMDLDYSPTGKEFATASYDKTIRIFPINQGTSREVYHTNRMQKVFAICYSQDSEYLYSGSQDMNLRIWKVTSSKPLGNLSARHQTQYNYREKVKDKFKYNKEIKKISKHRHVPKYIYNAKKQTLTKKDAKIRKLKNQELNNPNIFQKPKPERVAKVHGQQE